MVVVAGPPGSGKTTSFPVGALGIDAFSIDDRCAEIVGSYQAIPRPIRLAVANQCTRFIDEHIATRCSFAVETTLRTTAPIEQARRARSAGFLTQMLFVATDSADISVRRVRQRALSGGHGASEEQIRSAYVASLENLAAASRAFELCSLYDATADWQPVRRVATVSAGRVEVCEPVPDWVRRSLSGD
jgi:predicted ABC-type ATPase